MFSTFKSRLLLGVYIFVILSIPVGTYLASQTQNTKSSASEGKTTIIKSTPKLATSPAKELLKDSETGLLSESSQSSTPSSSSPTIATSFGPTLSLKAILEGRPTGNQVTKLFVGIFEGITVSTNPKFILSFTVDLPADGTYNNLSLAGLTSGNKYTAILKGSAQIATSSAFTMSPAVTNLNDGQPITMLTGDLNEDNVVNSADLTIAQKALGTTSKSSNWNESVDFNKDGVINIFDLALISKNLGQVGASGTWTSPIPKVTTSSGTPPIGSPESGTGYWIWVPK